MSGASLRNHHPSQVGTRLFLTILLNLVIFVVEFISGLFSNSLALVTDAFHNLTDFSTATISFAAHRIGKRGADSRRTFGYQRVEIFAAVLNVTILFAVAVVVFIKAYSRFRRPAPVNGGTLFIVSLIALVINAVAAWLLKKPSARNLNVRSAFLHQITDVASSGGAMVAGLLVLWKGWTLSDSVVSILIGAFIIRSGWRILKESTNILMDAAPHWLNIDDIKSRLEQLPEVDEVHHIHAWSLSSESVAFAAHIQVKNQTLEEVDRLAHTIREVLLHEFQIDHPTLQFETRKYEAVAVLCNGSSGPTAPPPAR